MRHGRQNVEHGASCSILLGTSAKLAFAAQSTDRIRTHRFWTPLDHFKSRKTIARQKGKRGAPGGSWNWCVDEKMRHLLVLSLSPPAKSFGQAFSAQSTDRIGMHRFWIPLDHSKSQEKDCAAERETGLPEGVGVGVSNHENANCKIEK